MAGSQEQKKRGRPAKYSSADALSSAAIQRKRLRRQKQAAAKRNEAHALFYNAYMPTFMDSFPAKSLHIDVDHPLIWATRKTPHHQPYHLLRCLITP